MPNLALIDKGVGIGASTFVVKITLLLQFFAMQDRVWQGIAHNTSCEICPGPGRGEGAPK